jgi:hypothetical protein
MKNKIFLDIDTERAQPIQIGKPEEFNKPTTPEEAQQMVSIDIACVCEALCTLIHIADQNKYGNKELLVKASIEALNTMLIPLDEKAKED